MDRDQIVETIKFHPEHPFWHIAQLLSESTSLKTVRLCRGWVEREYRMKTT